MDKRLIIAIDGPAASGKSTTARQLAQELGYVYLDTGAMYRACALKAKRSGIDLRDEQSISSMLNDLDISIKMTTDENVIHLDGEDVSQAIRANEISRLASDISALPSVRYKMVELQRQLGAKGGVILDGRDIGTFVFPSADIKFYLTASLEVRARRRWLELEKKGVSVDLESVMRDLAERDRNDKARDLAPLSKASDAVEIDTSEMSVEEQVEALYKIVKTRMGEL
ncbi:MAG: (d)CMP kinase [Candidatus Syntrophosphaera sp.]